MITREFFDKRNYPSNAGTVMLVVIIIFFVVASLVSYFFLAKDIGEGLGDLEKSLFDGTVSSFLINARGEHSRLYLQEEIAELKIEFSNGTQKISSGSPIQGSSEKFKEGIIYIDDDLGVKMWISDGKYCAYKGFDDPLHTTVNLDGLTCLEIFNQNQKPIP